MSYLEKLLDGKDLDWFSIGDERFFKIENNARKPVKASLRSSGKYPYYGANNIQDHVDDFTHDGEYLLIAEDGSACLDDYSIQYVSGKFWANNHVHVVRATELVLSRFAFHYLKTTKFYPFLTGGVRAKLTKGSLVQIPFPIPCPENPKKSLEIQAEIVRILDAFTAHTAELTAELTARKKQYNYYREKLLSFEDGEVKWMTLGEVSKKISSGGTPSTGVSEYYDGSIPWLRTQEIDFCEIWDTNIKITEAGVDNSSAKLIPENCVIVAMYGATVGKIGINKIPLTTNQACANICLDENIVNYRFVFHFLSSQYEYIKSLGAGSQTNINAQIVKNIKVPIPFANESQKSLVEQSRIVDILDKFDTLTKSISEGLPREIELRQKQYEYYRDLLLSFPKPETATVSA